MNNHKMSIVMVFGSFAIVSFFSTISSYELWMADGPEFLKKYSVNIYMSPWIIATFFIERFMLSSTVKALNTEGMWDIETVSDSSRSKMQKSITIKRFIASTYLVQSVVIAIVFPILGQLCGYSVHSDIHYVINYYNGSKFAKFLICAILYGAHQILAFHAISSYMLMKHTVQTVIIQLEILSDYLHQANQYRKHDYFLIRRHLRICAAHHILVLGRFKIVQEVCYLPFVYLLICGQAVLLCCSISLYYNRHPIYILQIGSILFLSYVLAMDCCQDGQSAEDALYEFRMNLSYFKWYDWDAVSKKILLIMLTRTQREETLKTLGLSIDRSLMIMILKFAYQAMLIFLRFT